jgi:hypothetical protein
MLYGECRHATRDDHGWVSCATVVRPSEKLRGANYPGKVPFAPTGMIEDLIRFVYHARSQPAEMAGCRHRTRPMSITFASERRLVAADEFEPIVRSHYPVVETLSRDELVDLARWLRERRARARDIARSRRRAVRGKADPRGGATEAASERGLLAKKQVYANALKRVNARLATTQATERRALALANLQAALGRKQAAVPHHPQPGQTANAGFRLKRSAERRRVIQAARIGSVSQSVRGAQAARDSRAV